MNVERPSRKLVAIMFTDIDDYSILVERDENLSMEMLGEYREISRKIFERYRGREIRTMGDGIFVEFSSIVEAVECAISLQTAFEERNKNVPPEKIFYVRIGIHSGDVIAQEGDIYGTAVNIAARVEPLAHPGGVCITEQVYNQVQGIVSLPLKSMGVHKLKNLKNSVELYYVAFPWIEEKKIAPLPGGALSEKKGFKILNFKLLLILLFIIFSTGIYYAIKNYPKIKVRKLEKSSIQWIDSIAVLPFVNMTQNKENDLISDGITEEIINSLSRLKGLKVCARTSAFSFKGKEIDIRTIGKKLGVNLILEGSIRQSENKYKITAQLIQAEDGFHLWSDSFLLDSIDPFLLQEKIAIKIADKLKGNMDISEIRKVKRGTEDLTAYNLYLIGRSKWLKRNVEDIKDAIKYYENAIEIDPNFALAYLGIAECYVIMPYYGILKDKESYPYAKNYAQLALEKDPYLAEAYSTLAIVYDAYERNYNKAEEFFNKAIYLKPSYAVAHQWFSIHLRRMGKLDLALKHAKIALELDPLSLVIKSTFADTYYDRREYEKAEEIYRELLEADDNFVSAHLYLSGIYLNQSRCQEAQTELKLEKDHTRQWVFLKKMFEARIYAHCGNPENAIKIAKEIEDEIKKEKVNYHMFLALIYCSTGKNQEAIKWVEKAIDERDDYFFLFMWEKDFDSIRSMKEYKDLIFKFNLPEELLNFKLSQEEIDILSPVS